MANNQLYDMMRKRVVHITIKPPKRVNGEHLYQTGIVIDRGSDFAYIISDARQLAGKIGVYDIVITFPGEEKIHPRPRHFHIINGVVGIVCHGLSNANLAEKIEICNQPLLMCQEVFVYEADTEGITGGNITLFDGDHFSNDCAVANYSQYGAPVVTKRGELAGICDSNEYHNNAKSILSLLGTIESIRSQLGI